jgi:hypothetical protein
MCLFPFCIAGLGVQGVWGIYMVIEEYNKGESTAPFGSTLLSLAD